MPVCECVGYTGEPCKNGGTDRDIVWGTDWRGTNKPAIGRECTLAPPGEHDVSKRAAACGLSLPLLWKIVQPDSGCRPIYWSRTTTALPYLDITAIIVQLGQPPQPGFADRRPTSVELRSPVNSASIRVSMVARRLPWLRVTLPGCWRRSTGSFVLVWLASIRPAVWVVFHRPVGVGCMTSPLINCSPVDDTKRIWQT